MEHKKNKFLLGSKKTQIRFSLLSACFAHLLSGDQRKPQEGWLQNKGIILLSGQATYNQTKLPFFSSSRKKLFRVEVTGAKSKQDRLGFLKSFK